MSLAAPVCEALREAHALERAGLGLALGFGLGLGLELALGLAFAFALGLGSGLGLAGCLWSLPEKSLPLTTMTVPPCVGPPVGATIAATGGGKYSKA